MNALRELLQRLAIREPLVLYIDDLQWGDVDSAALLADLVRPPDAPQMMLLGSYRSEDKETSSCLRALTEAYQKGQHLPHREELAVESLTASESTQLALQLLGRDDETSRAFAKKIAQESHGWPFFVWELVQHVQEDPEIADQVLELDEVIWARVKRLPEEHDSPVRADRRRRSADPGGGSLSSAWTRWLKARAYWLSCGPTTSFAQRNPKRKEPSSRHITTVSAKRSSSTWTQQTVRGHNLNLALMTERVSGLQIEDIQAHINRTPAYEEPGQPYSLDKQQWQRVFDAACFFDAAGEHERAFPFALIAAEQAWSQNALDVAEQQFQIAERGAKSATDAIRFRIAEGLGDVLMMRARYDQASLQFESARALAKENVTFARIDGKRGYLCFKKGDMANSAKHFEQALTELGNPTPSNVVTQTIALVEGSYGPSAAYLLSVVVRGASQAGLRQSWRMDMLRARLYDGLGYPYWFTKGPVPTLWTHLRHMNLAERYPPSQELGRAYAMHAVT